MYPYDNNTMMGNGGGYGMNTPVTPYGYGSYMNPQGQQQGNTQNMGSSLMTAIPSILQGFGAMGNNGGNNTLNTLGGNSANLSNALTNTNNPLYQQIYGQERQQNMSNLAGGLNMMQGQNRLQSAMGRVPLFAQGRGGEEAFRGLMNGYQNADLQAQQQARSSIGQALQGTTQGGYLGAQQQRANSMQNNGMLNSFNSIGQLLKSFGGM